MWTECSENWIELEMFEVLFQIWFSSQTLLISHLLKCPRWNVWSWCRRLSINHFSQNKEEKIFIFNTCYPCPMLGLSLLYSASSFLGRTILHQFSLILDIWCRYWNMFDVGDGIYQASFVINFHFVNIFKWKKSNEAGWRVVWFSFLACDILILILDSARLSFRPASPGTRSQCFIRAGEMVFLFPAPVGDSIIQ